MSKDVEIVSIASSAPITVSSESVPDTKRVLLRYVYKNDPSKTNTANGSFTLSERCPVTWSPSLTEMSKPCISVCSENYTPTPKAKVNSWFCQNGPLLPQNSLNSTPISGDKRKTSILVRHDFKKEFSITSSSNNTKSTNATSPHSHKTTNELLIKHNVFRLTTNEIKVEKKFEIDSTISSDKVVKKAPIQISPVNKEILSVFVNNDVSRANSEKSDSIEVNNLAIELESEKKRKFSTDEIPLSPESQKKKELCAYLQLINMTAAVKKPGAVITNRRSTRVKNHILLTEKKELEKRLNSEAQKEEMQKSLSKSHENSDLDKENSGRTSRNHESIVVTPKKHTENGVRYSKSFQELGMTVSQQEIEENLEDTTVNFKKFFSEDVARKSLDFDHAITDYFKNEKIRYIGVKKPSAILRKQIHKYKLILQEKRKRKSENAKHKVPKRIHKFKKDTQKKLDKFKLKNSFKKHVHKNIIKVKRKTNENGRLPNRPARNYCRKLVGSAERRSLRSTENLQHIGIKTILLKRKKNKQYTKRKPKNPEPPDKSPEHEFVYEENTPGDFVMDYSQAIAQQVQNDHDYVLQEQENDKFVTRTFENCKSPSAESKGENENKESEDEDNRLVEKEFEEDVDEDVEQEVQDENLELEDENKEVEEDEDNREFVDGNKELEQDLDESEESEDEIKELEEEMDEEEDEDQCSDDDNEDLEEDNSEPFLGFADADLSRSENFIKYFEDLQKKSSKPPLKSPKDTDSTKENPYIKLKRIDASDSATSSPRNSMLLHRNLLPSKQKRKCLDFDADCEMSDPESWETCSNSGKTLKRPSQSHSVRISPENGRVIKAHYVDFDLVIAQEFSVSFWTQSALGNVLGAQDMWIPRGRVDRLVLDNGCVQKSSDGMVVGLGDGAAYVELWTKEHKSDKRERPVADVFATVYFCRQRRNGILKKVLQLENIHGYASDVQYVVLRNSPNIVVSWYVRSEDTYTTIVHCYHMAADYQTVDRTQKVGSVDHYVSSLHNIKGCDNLVLGWGEDKVTLWNLEYGYVVVTVELLETIPLVSTLWAKCDRGFLFILQRLANENLCLIAVNGINHSWKRLQTYVPPPGYEGLQGVCLDNGILVAFYETGILCWKVLTGELRVEEVASDTAFIPSGKHVIMITNNQVCVRHAGSYLITCEDT